MILSAGRLAVLAAAGCAVVAGCVRGGGSSPVPRPEAYPRIDLYPSFYRAVDLPDGRVIQVNDSAGVDVDAEGWVNISYPKYGVTVNCTLTRVSEATVGDVLSNRDERMALNTGDTYGEVMRLGSRRGSSVSVFVAQGGSLTPVQFIATDSVSYVFSGAAVMESAVANADSVRPVVDAVAADILYMLRSL